METPSTSSVSLSSLLCQESGAIFFSDENGVSDSEDDYVQLLLQREKSDSSLPPPPHLSKTARLDAINYIFHITDCLGFESQTAYLAVTYLDRFVSLRTLDTEKGWATELLCMGCLSLAAKLHECNVPGLSSFQLGVFRFEIKAIQRMELLILTTLDWKIASITPFAFLPYFIDKLFGRPLHGGTFTRILELMKDIRLMDHYPSAIACAAVLMSIDESLTRNSVYSKIKGLHCSRFLDIDDVTICYLMMQRLERTKILKLLATPPMGSFRNSQTTSSSISSKRRRLLFCDSDNMD